MGKATGFLEIERKDRTYEAPEARVQNFREFVIPLSEDMLRDQAARCMDCGVPYCHNGCPVNNQIPDWNDLVYEDDWQAALANLHSTIISRNSPDASARHRARAACTLNIDDSPVTIKSSNVRLSTRAGKMAGLQPNHRLKKPANRWQLWGWSGRYGRRAATCAPGP